MGDTQPKRVLRSAKTVEMAAKKEEKEEKETPKEVPKETKSEAEKPVEEPKPEADSSLFDDDEEEVPELRKTRRRVGGEERT